MSMLKRYESSYARRRELAHLASILFAARLTSAKEETLHSTSALEIIRHAPAYAVSCVEIAEFIIEAAERQVASYESKTNSTNLRTEARP